MMGILKKVRGRLGNALVGGPARSVVTVPVAGLLFLLEGGYLTFGIAPRIAGTLFAGGFLAEGTFSTYLGLA